MRGRREVDGSDEATAGFVGARVFKAASSSSSPSSEDVKTGERLGFLFVEVVLLPCEPAARAFEDDGEYDDIFSFERGCRFDAEISSLVLGFEAFWGAPLVFSLMRESILSRFPD